MQEELEQVIQKALAPFEGKEVTTDVREHMECAINRAVTAWRLRLDGYRLEP